MPPTVSNRKLNSYPLCASAICLSYIARILEVSGSRLVSASLQCRTAEGEFPNPFCLSCTVWICWLQLQCHILTKSHSTKEGSLPLRCSMSFLREEDVPMSPPSRPSLPPTRSRSHAYPYTNQWQRIGL